MTANSNSEDTEGVVVALSAGDNIVKYKPIFSHDSKYLFVISGNKIRVYSTNTGECVRKLIGHNADIISILLNPKNCLQIVSCSSDGEFIFWDYLDGSINKKFSIYCAVNNFFWPSSDSLLYVITSDPLKLFEVESLEIIKKPFEMWNLVFDKIQEKDKIAVGLSGKYVVNMTNNSLLVYNTATKQYFRHIASKHQEFTSVATHPTDYCIATGDRIGRIYLWYDFMTGIFRRSCIHWHQLPLSAVTFSPEGNSILSGGGECALVKWMMVNGTYGDTRTVIPRLGMPICQVATSPDNTVTAISHVDNAIQLLDSQSKVLHLIQGFSRGHYWSEFDWDPAPTGLLFDPRSKAIVTNGRPGHLQFFSALEEKHLYNLDITNVNYHHSERTYKVYPTEIDKAAFDSKGDWLATVERRDDGVTSVDVRLKFWKFKERSSNFELNTQVEAPHLGKINSLKFQPHNSPTIVTTSADDKRFKIWKLVDESDIYKRKSGWICQSVGYFRELPPSDSAFSEDGSILAVSFNHIITLWIPDTMLLKGTLCHLRLQENIKQIEFGQRSCSHLLMSIAENTMNAWDVLSLTVKWCLNLSVVYLTKDVNSNLMAAFTNKKEVYIFEPSSATPLYIHENISEKAIIAASYIPHHTDSSKIENKISLSFSSDNSTLYFLTEDLILHKIVSKSEIEEERMKTVSIQSNLSMTPFGLLIAEKTKSDVPQYKQTIHEMQVKTSEVLLEIYTSPSHTLPPVTMLCDLLLSATLKKNKSRIDDKKSTKTDSEDDDEPMEADSESESEFTTRDSAQKPFESCDVKPEVPKTVAEHLSEEKKLREIQKESFDWLFS